MDCVTVFILPFLLVFSLAGALFAAENGDSSPLTELAPIVVSAKRSVSSSGDSGENLYVLGSSGIARTPAEEQLSEVLQYIPGIDIEPRSGIGKATALSIQGADPRQVRMMIDGIPLNTQSSGQANPSIFPVNDISRVEVIKGPGSSAWGSALGGVVNVITKDTGTTLVPHGSVTGSVAGYDTTRQSFDLSGKAAGIGYYVMGDYLDSGGKGRRDDTLEKNWFDKFSYVLPDDGKLTASFGYSGGDDSTRFPDDSWVNQQYRSRYGKIGLEDEFEGTHVTVEAKHYRQDLTSRQYLNIDGYDLNTFASPNPEVNTLDRLYELSLTGSRTVRAADTLVFGADFDYDKLKSDPYLLKAEHLDSYAPYANYTLNFGRTDLIFGGRYDDNSVFGQAFSPSAGAVHRFSDPWMTVMKVRASRAFNAPPLLWKFYNPVASPNVGNPDIRAERGNVYEFETESSPIERLTVKGSLYRADIHDALSSVDVGSGLFMMKNFEKFRRQGAALETRYVFPQGLGVSAAAAFNDEENRITRETVRGSGKPRQSFNLGADYTHNGFFCGLTGYYKRWNESPDLAPNDRKFIFDAKARQSLGKNALVFFSVYNLGNSAYWSDSFYPLRKRYYEAGLTISW